MMETFEITGRGAVVVISEITKHSVGKPHKVEVVTPKSQVIGTKAFNEWLLRGQQTPVENEAYMRKDLHKKDIPAGSRLRFIEQCNLTLCSCRRRGQRTMFCDTFMAGAAHLNR